MEKVEISHKTIIFTVLLLLALWILFQIRMVILIWFIAFILMTALNPLVSGLERFKIPRILATLLIFILGIGLISAIVAGIIPALIDQINTLTKIVASSFPDYPKILQLDSTTLTSQLETLSRNAINVLKIVTSAASNLITVFSLIVLTVYLLIERKNLKHYLAVLFRDANSERRAEELIDNIEKSLGGWVRGEIMLMLIVGILSYIGLILLGIPFALPLALLAGLLELIPNIGPIISSVPAIITGLTISPVIGLGVVVLYLAVQQLENHLIVPVVMRQAAGIKPLITLACLMVGLALGGVLGAILAVPSFVMFEVIVKDVYKYRSENK